MTSQPLISAAPARAHIRALAKAGVGCNTLADAAGVSIRCVWFISSGRRQRIRPATARAILSVDASAMDDHRSIDAAPTRRRIDQLVAEGGFTKREIARRLGRRNRLVLDFYYRKRISLRLAAAIERFHHRYLIQDRQS